MHQEFINTYERFKPSNAQLVYEIKNEVNIRKNQLIEEFDLYVKRKYGFDTIIVDRL
jgi:hypothetical protein